MNLPQGSSAENDVRRADQSETVDMRAAIAGAAGPVRRFLFTMCGRWDQAEDLAQDALLKAWRNRDSFRGQSGATTWIFAIARNHWLDSLRRKKRQAKSEPMDEQLVISDPSSQPHATAARRELAEVLRRAMDTLPPDQREALALRESEGLRFPEIAELLAVPVATAKSRVRYALLKLADELAHLRSELES